MKVDPPNIKFSQIRGDSSALNIVYIVFFLFKIKLFQIPYWLRIGFKITDDFVFKRACHL